MNSIRENKKYLVHNLRLAKVHLENSQEYSAPKKTVFDPSLEKMYSKKIEYRTVTELSEEMMMLFEDN